MAIVSTLALFLMLINYKITIINSVAAAESSYILIHKDNREAVVNGEPTSQKIDFIDCSCEREFNEMYPIVWSGRVIASFVSGEDIGVQKYNENDKYNKFYVIGGGMFSGETGIDVKVTGRLVGVTCAYANTIFGECVGLVEADQILSLN